MKLWNRSRKMIGVLVLCLGLMSVGNQSAWAQGGSIGVIDEDKLADGYTAYKKALSDINARAQSLDKQLAARELLSETEGKRFDELIVKNNRPVAEEQELTNLVKTGTDRLAKYRELISKPRSPAEETEWKNMLEMAKNAADPLRRVSDTLYGKVKEEQDKTEKTYTDKANKVIEQIANDKKLSLVMRKLAVIWSSPTIDITEEVLSRLNK
ncbi:MAG: OmpH family outer membrane protein [Armatimonadota bacterium]|nr:OmpH family outer membrane protein [Armatimonadota bacterium]